MTLDPTLVDSPRFDGAAVALDPAEPVAEPGASSSMDADADADAENENGSFPLLLGFIAVILALGVFQSWWIPGLLAGLLFMLFMHELGHYVTARASGMKVTEFFLGFGPKIWSFNRGETEYGVKAIPAGAYVRIIGMTNLDEIDPAEEHRTYRAQPYWQRMMTICAGSAMHFLMAIVCAVFLFGAYNYAGFYGEPWVVDLVVEGSSADEIGVEVGDSIVSFDGRDFNNWVEFGEVVSSTDLGPVEVVVERGGEQLTLAGELGPRSQDVILDGFGLIMIEEDASLGWQVSYVWPGDPAEQFGLEPRDVLVSAGDVTRPSQFTMANALSQAEGSEIDIDVLRDGQLVSLRNTVVLNDSPTFRGFLGIGREHIEQQQPGWGASVGRAFDEFGTLTKTNLVGLADMVNPARLLGADDDQVVRRASLLPTEGQRLPLPQIDDDEPANRPLSIIGVFRLFAESESVDEALLLFMIVNIFIGLFNLFPLLPLDGGHAAIATYERGRQVVTRRPHRVDAAKLIPLTWVVILLLVSVGIWATALDIFSWPA